MKKTESIFNAILKCNQENKTLSPSVFNQADAKQHFGPDK